MRTYYCKKCGTANEIEETMEKFFCANCGTENSVPPVSYTHLTLPTNREV